MAEPTLHWQGAAEVTADEAVRVGSLYLLGDVLYFVDGGRTDKRGKPHEVLFVIAAALATAPLTIEASVFLWVEGGKGMWAWIAQVVSAIVSVAFVVLAVVTRDRMRAADAEAMRVLGAMDAVPPVALLDDWCVEDGGSFRVPLADLDVCAPEGDRGVSLVTHLLDRYSLTVEPDRDRLVERCHAGRTST